MTKWAAPQVELVQLITPDGDTIDLTSESQKGDWVLRQSGWGMPGISYITQRGPFQHGVNARDFRLQPRTIQLLLRQQACDRDDYWAKRAALLDAIRPNRQAVGLAGVIVDRSQYGYQGQTIIYSLSAYQNRLYGGTGATGRLFRWIEPNAWEQVAAQLNGQTQINALYGSNLYLYAGTSPGGRLFRFPDAITGQWEQVAPALLAQTDINDIAVWDDGGGNDVYGCTSPNGMLFQWNGVNAWVQMCAQLAAETDVLCLQTHDPGAGEQLYAGTSPGGRLYHYWAGGGTWVELCAMLNGQTQIWDLASYNGQLYGCTAGGGRLFRYDPTGPNWVQVAPQYGAHTVIRRLVIYQGRLYGLPRSSDVLLRWNNVDAWEQVADAVTPISPVRRSAISYNNRLLIGDSPIAILREYIRRPGSADVPCCTLRRVLSDGSIRDLCVLAENGPEFDHEAGGWDEWSIQELVRLWAPNPVVYDPTVRTGPTYTMAAGDVLETQTLTYEGTWEEHPTLAITGPLDNPVIRNEATDEFIALVYNIIATQTVTFTLTPGAQTVVDNNGDNLIGDVSPDSNLESFHLAPDPEVAGGANDITIIGENAGVGTSFVITYRRRYIGI